MAITGKSLAETGSTKTQQSNDFNESQQLTKKDNQKDTNSEPTLTCSDKLSNKNLDKNEFKEFVEDRKTKSFRDKFKSFTNVCKIVEKSVDIVLGRWFTHSYITIFTQKVVLLRKMPSNSNQ